MLGLADDAGERSAPPPADWRAWAFKSVPGTVFDQPEPAELIELTVIVPARDGADCLEACLQSLVSQSEEMFALGRDWERSWSTTTHRPHRGNRRGFSGVALLPAAQLDPGWTGKANAVWTAARRARGRWLLFTDADTVHQPGSLRRAIHEAQRHKAGMLSYSPSQIVKGLVQRTLMPLVFSELSVAYPPPRFPIRRSASPPPTASFCWWNAKPTAAWAVTPALRTRCWKTWNWLCWPSGVDRAAFALRRGCARRSHVPLNSSAARGLGKEPGAALR